MYKTYRFVHLVEDTGELLHREGVDVLLGRHVHPGHHCHHYL
jgi:hypothetical protein